jgi:hypothetical protein
MLLRIRGRLDVFIFPTIIAWVRTVGFLGSNFLRCQKTTAWTPRASHRVFVTGFMQIRLENG